MSMFYYMKFQNLISEEWLDCWALCDKQTKEGFLTADTYFAFRHIVKSLVKLLKHLLVTMKVYFVLTGKFQNDNLESRFGHYRQMNGGNRLISIQEILESKKKIKINSMLKLYAADGEITIKDFLFDLSSVGDLNKKTLQFRSTFCGRISIHHLKFCNKKLAHSCVCGWLCCFKGDEQAELQQLQKKFCHQEKI